MRKNHLETEIFQQVRHLKKKTALFVKKHTRAHVQLSPIKLMPRFLLG